MPGIARDNLSSDQKALKMSDTPSPTKNFSKLLRPPSQNMDAETLHLAKEYPYLVTADPIPLPESGSDGERNHFEPAKQHRHEEVRVRDFAFPGAATDETNLKALQPPSLDTGSHRGDATVTRTSGYTEIENVIDRRQWRTSQCLPTAPSRVSSPQAAESSPLNLLSSSATETILLNAAPPLDHRTMNVIPMSRKKSATPSPPPNKPLPPLPTAQDSPQPALEALPNTKQETASLISGHEPPIPPKSPRRSKRNTLYAIDDKELEALASLSSPTSSPARPMTDHHAHNPNHSGESGSSSPSQRCDGVGRTHDELLQWRKVRNEKTQARKKRDLEHSRTEQRPTNAVYGPEADGADDTDDTIILPVVTSSVRASAFSPDKTSPPPHDRWDHLNAVADNKSPATHMKNCAVSPPTSSRSLDTRSFSPLHRRRTPTEAMNSGETSLPTNKTTPVVLQPAPLHTRRNVSILSTTRPLYKHSTQGTLYIPPSPPLSPAAPTSDEDTTPKKLSNRASFVRHRSRKSYATVIKPEAENGPEDFSLYPSETESQLQAELAVERKRSALLKAALVAMINASAQFESPPASEAGNRLSSLSGRSAGSGPLDVTLEAMLDSIAGGNI
ncbi:hypothetical protein MMC26_002455 [Xylographa opegraphella]|nr:hypothetical protein [Xylographa opegraphella]